MNIHACILGNEVKELIPVTSESHYFELASRYSSVIDVSEFILKPEVGWIFTGVEFSPPAHQQVDLAKMIRDRIYYFQSQASALLTDMYVANTLAGISSAQSDAMFDDYSDVLLRIREGAWPTALYRLNQKQPQGFVTQAIIDNWKALLLARMN